MMAGAMALRQSAATRPGHRPSTLPERPDRPAARRSGLPPTARSRAPGRVSSARTRGQSVRTRASISSRIGERADQRPRGGGEVLEQRCRPAARRAAVRSHAGPCAAERDPAGPLPRTLSQARVRHGPPLPAGGLLLGTAPAFAQPVPVPDCTVDVTVHEQLTLDVVYRCRSSAAAHLRADGRADAAPYLRRRRRPAASSR